MEISRVTHIDGRWRAAAEEMISLMIKEGIIQSDVEIFNSDHGVFLTEGEKIVGMTIYNSFGSKRDCTIRFVYVREEFRERGAATSMMKTVEEDLLAAGFRLLFLNVVSFEMEEIAYNRGFSRPTQYMAKRISLFDESLDR